VCHPKCCLSLLIVSDRAGKLGDLRSGDDDLRIDQFLVEFGVLALLIGGGNEGVALIFEPFPYSQLILRRTDHFSVIGGVLSAIVQDKEYFPLQLKGWCQFIVPSLFVYVIEENGRFMNLSR